MLNVIVMFHYLFEQVKAGRLEPEEIPDRAIMWKIARMPPLDEEIDEDLAERFRKIVRF